MKLLSHKNILVWCEVCNKRVWIRAKNIEDILNEANWHKMGFCIRNPFPKTSLDREHEECSKK